MTHGLTPWHARCARGPPLRPAAVAPKPPESVATPSRSWPARCRHRPAAGAARRNRIIEDMVPFDSATIRRPQKVASVTRVVDREAAVGGVSRNSSTSGLTRRDTRSEYCSTFESPGR